MSNRLFVARRSKKLTVWMLPPALVLIVIGYIVVFSQQNMAVALMYLVALLSSFSAVAAVHRKPRPHLQTIVISAIMSLTLLYGFEFTLRHAVFSQPRPPDGWVDDVRYTWGIEVANNSHQFREREFPPNKPDGTRRILVLGDSITWGVGLPAELRYTNLLEQHLNQNSSNTRYEVYNLAQEGGNTADQKNILRHYQDLIDPDLVIVGFNENDAEPSNQQATARRQSLRDRIAAPLNPLQHLNMPHIRTAAVDGTLYLGELLNLVPSVQPTRQPYDRSSPAWHQFSQSLRDIKQITDKRNLPAPIFTILNAGLHKNSPTNYAQPAQDPELPALLKRYEQAAAAAQSLGFRVVNHTDEITRRLDGQILAVNQFDTHPSAALHQLYAEKLFETIITYPNVQIQRPAKFRQVP